ncbi:MAG: DJ-1/PfpI family protein [Ornithinimicrobium sp.]
MRIGILLFDQVDLLDVGGPYEVFLTANRLAQRRGGPAPFEVLTIGLTTDPVEAYGGLMVQASDHVDSVGPLDVLIVPGTIDLDGPAETLAPVLRALADSASLITSVCTGSVLLARAGLLDDVSQATTHHEDVALLAEVIGDRAVTARWVDAGPVVTAGGLSSGLAMALHLVDRLVDRELAVTTAAQVAYDWDPEDGILLASD